ncbi:hypothetical protein [Nitrogeniibacter aestuarii]|uniref:hypothetical protein n=1 Tax=Nitrogeniibacter aestuarii TaxID=2815343 RepID=UPI001E311B1C|nr:hypothetical protein [Nitrogeniibacter aestuarii]
MSVTRNQLKDALRASIETEDDALKQRKPPTLTRRKAAIKSGIKAARKAAGIDVEPVASGKPLEVPLSKAELALIKQVRDQLKSSGVTASKSDVLRLGLMLLQEAPADVLADACAALPKLRPAKD